MLLSDQLYELRNNILRDRSDLIAGNTDQLWSDATLLLYIEDAERRFARRTLLLRDGTTSAATQVVLRTGIKTYALHESLLGVLSARYNGNEFDLKRSGHALVSDLTPPEFLAFDPTSGYTLAPGEPLAFYTDETLVYAGENRVTLSVYPLPSAIENGKKIQLRVLRLPLAGYTSDDLGRSSEIPKDYQLDVLEWAAYRAMRGFDGDAGSPVKAEAHKAAFEQAITEAQQETKRKIHVAGGVRYGGNGFSWTR